MQRKLIRQGKGDSLTVYLPKKWIDNHGLAAGDHVDVLEDGDSLRILTHKHESVEGIQITVPVSRESMVRGAIVNAYRAGYDKIELTYQGPHEHVTRVVQQFLIGFEITDHHSTTYTIESMSEPRYDDFSKLFVRQFHLLSQVLADLPNNVDSHVFQIQRYDNFCKRCLMKGVFEDKAKPFIWHFLSQLTHIARLCMHVQHYIESEKSKLSTEEQKILSDLRLMWRTIAEAYFSQDFSRLMKVHELEDVLIRKDVKKRFADSDIAIVHQLLQIGKLIYLSNSALIGYLQLHKRE